MHARGKPSEEDVNEERARQTRVDSLLDDVIVFLLRDVISAVLRLVRQQRRALVRLPLRL